MALKWKKKTDLCPKCKEPTEVLIVRGIDRIDYEEAERCLKCGWEIRFTDNGPVRVK